jgi:hypothetical protein
LGNEFINNFTQDYYQSFINSWQKAINYYLKTGKKLRLGKKV